MDGKIRGILMMHEASHRKIGAERLSLSRGNGESGLDFCQGFVEVEERYGTVVDADEDVRSASTKLIVLRKSNLKKNESENEKRNGMERKKMWRQFARDTNTKTVRKCAWLWMQNGDLKREIEVYARAAQKRAPRTNYVTRRIDNENQLRATDANVSR